MRVVAALFGRKGVGGQSISRKNWTPILGRPILEYARLAITHSTRLQERFVSTDDPDIAAWCRPHGFKHIDRPASLCGPDAAMEDAIQHAVNAILEQAQSPPDAVAILMCNAPTITSAVIDESIDRLCANSLLDSVVTVNRLNMFTPLRARRVGGIGDTLIPAVENTKPTKLSTSDRAALGDMYFGDSGVSTTRIRALKSIRSNPPPFPWQGGHIGYITQEAMGGDLDEPWQRLALEHWLRGRGFSENQTPYDENER